MLLMLSIAVLQNLGLLEHQSKPERSVQRLTAGFVGVIAHAHALGASLPQPPETKGLGGLCRWVARVEMSRPTGTNQWIEGQTFCQKCLISPVNCRSADNA